VEDEEDVLVVVEEEEEEDEDDVLSRVRDALARVLERAR
jgi:hypothetical protein